MQAEIITAEYPDAYGELTEFGLIQEDPDRPGKPVARNPKRALENILFAQLEEASRRVAFMSALPDLTNQLAGQYAAAAIRPGRSSEYLDDQTAANSRIQDVVAGAKTEILAAQPGGPRDQRILDQALSRDAAALDRGVTMRTVYRDTVRDHPVTAEYARRMATREAVGSAQYRTLPGEFERMIIVDREQAFVSDHITGGPAHAAWHVTDRAVIAVLASMFDQMWLYGEPWTGALHSRRGRLEVDTVSGTDGVRTSARQRQILRYIADGVSQPSIARRIGVSKRKLEQEIAALKSLWGAATLPELAYHWALSPDHLVDDGPVTAADQPATTTGSAT
jgi:sugar-specific transcriptional regulator TrmB